MKPRALVTAMPAEQDAVGMMPPQICVSILPPSALNEISIGTVYAMTIDEATALRDALTRELNGLQGQPPVVAADPKAQA